jgi:hypothetical protein
MNYLEEYFKNNTKRSIHKWTHYFEIYDFYFSRFRNKDIKLLEIGVDRGGSLQMWKEYFGKEAKIYAIDANPKVFFEEDQVSISIGSQQDRVFLKDFVKTNGTFDIIIDDGGHRMNQMIISLEELYPALNDNGIYLIEDVHCSYYERFGGGLKKEDTIIEYTKNLVDIVNSRVSEVKDDIFSENLLSLHFHEDIIVFHKNKKPERRSMRKGAPGQ